MKRPKRKTKTRPVEDEDQSRAFIEKAREIGADEGSSGAEELMGRLAKMAPDPITKPRQRRARLSD